MKPAREVCSLAAAFSPPQVAIPQTDRHVKIVEVDGDIENGGGIRGRRFSEYYNGDKTLLGQRPFTFKTHDRSRQPSTMLNNSGSGGADGKSNNATITGGYELYRAAGAVPDKFRALSLKGEADTYVNLTQAAQRDIMAAAKEEIKAELEINDRNYYERKAAIKTELDAQQGNRKANESINREDIKIDVEERDATCSVVNRVREAWDRAVQFAFPGINKMHVCISRVFVAIHITCATLESLDYFVILLKQ